MKINDQRNKKTEFKFDELAYGQVYVSNRLQKYVMRTQNCSVICLESGELFDDDECDGDVFIPVQCELVVE